MQGYSLAVGTCRPDADETHILRLVRKRESSSAAWEAVSAAWEAWEQARAAWEPARAAWEPAKAAWEAWEPARAAWGGLGGGLGGP